ncbi:MAG: lytic transglycosylase domain-containing protein [Rhodanobacteraceae bacterium]
MNAMFGQGAGGRRAGTLIHPLRGLHAMAGCGLLLAVAWAGPAAASVLYRCSGPAGEVAYVSHTEGYRHCEKIGAWAAPVRRIEASARRTEPPPQARVSPGTPPRAVEANPAVLKVTPLGHADALTVKKLVRPQVWQPFPVAILDALGGRVLPDLLGVRAVSPAAQPAPAPAPSTTAAIPLKLEADAPKPPRTGAVYRVVQKNGTVLYTNVATLARGRDAKILFTYVVECYACNVHSKIDWNTVPLHLTAYHGDVVAAARLSGVDTALLRAVIHAESGFNPRALSYKGAQGLMQLMPGTAFELGVGDAFDPAENISGGARYLAMLLRTYHGDVRLAAAAYNAGAAAVAKYGGVPPYAETEVYVKRVALLYQRYRKALAVQDAPALAATKDIN